jgi:hypothetical protein
MRWRPAYKHKTLAQKCVSSHRQKCVSSHRGSCDLLRAWRGNNRSLEGNGGPLGGVPILHKGQPALALRYKTGASEGSKPRSVGAVGAPSQ